MSLRALIYTYRLTFLVHVVAICLTLSALWFPNWVVGSPASSSATTTSVLGSPVPVPAAQVQLHVGLAEVCITDITSSSITNNKNNNNNNIDFNGGIKSPGVLLKSCTAFPKCRSTPSKNPTIGHGNNGDNGGSGSGSGSSDNSFCVAWQTAAFLMWVTVVLQFGTAIAYVSPFTLGDLYFVQTGWRVISYFLATTVVVQGTGAMTLNVLYTVSPASRFTGSAGGGDIGGTTAFLYNSIIGTAFSSHHAPLVLSLGMSWWMAAVATLLSATNLVILVVVGYLNPPDQEYSLGDYVCIMDEEEEDQSDYYYFLQRSQLENLGD